mmetsp:Transcript_55510/g.172257  ORF Transcript_55510/g.172257 Transcript_55510/m.172257 type:complete len:291 (+) Transcript_55510:417-1289(+)
MARPRLHRHPRSEQGRRHGVPRAQPRLCPRKVHAGPSIRGHLHQERQGGFPRADDCQLLLPADRDEERPQRLQRRDQHALLGPRRRQPAVPEEPAGGEADLQRLDQAEAAGGRPGLRDSRARHGHDPLHLHGVQRHRWRAEGHDPGPQPRRPGVPADVGPAERAVPRRLRHRHELRLRAPGRQGVVRPDWGQGHRAPEALGRPARAERQRRADAGGALLGFERPPSPEQGLHLPGRHERRAGPLEHLAPRAQWRRQAQRLRPGGAARARVVRHPGVSRRQGSARGPWLPY